MWQARVRDARILPAMSRRVLPIVVCLALGCSHGGASSGTGSATTTDAPTAGSEGTGSQSPTGSDTAAATSTGETGADAESSTGTDPAAIEEIQIEVGSLVFDARAAGPADGDLVLLLHGFPETSYEWLHHLGALGQAGYRAVAPNQRGYSPGARPEAVEDYALNLLVDDVLGMADELGASRFHLAGHDWGAGVAWGVAVAAPERVASLSTFSVPHLDAFDMQLADMRSCQYGASAYFDFFSTPGVETTMLANDAAQLRGVYGDLDPAAVDDYLEVLGSEAALGAALNWYRANIVERRFVGTPLGPVTVPTMFVWSDQDSAVCQEGADDTASFVRGPYRYEVLPGVDHWIPERASKQTAAWMLEQLAAYEL